MKQLSFYKFGECRKKEHIKDWPNWTGEVPQSCDLVLLHFGDYNEKEKVYRVLRRVIDGRYPDNIDIIITEVE